MNNTSTYPGPKQLFGIEFWLKLLQAREIEGELLKSIDTVLRKRKHKFQSVNSTSNRL
jgi:hypothetical protein